MKEYEMEDINVLLVDDEKDFVQSLAERLELRDIKTQTALNGEEALDRIPKDTPSVIVLDLRLPGMDGLEVLRKVKSVRSDVQVVILTGHGAETDREQALNFGAFDYLQKPVSMQTLVETLKKAHKKYKSIKIG
jgi:DNA-binding NtrC family response regulator